MLTVVQRKKIRAAAARGARLLDRVGAGWERRVKLTKVHQQAGTVSRDDGCGCVLAQLCGSYDRGLIAVGLGLDPLEEERLGFMRIGGYSDPTRDRYPASETWAELTEAWRDEIRARRAKRASS